MMIIPRSGNALKKGWIIPNAPGLIDADYRGEWKVLVTWIPHPYETLGTEAGSDIALSLAKSTHSHKFKEGHTIVQGTRIAQGVLVKYEEQEWEEVDTLPETERGEGGFGSTGVKDEAKN
jgi:dUTP pyrophosphatase